jgi:hypothetical protein
MWEQAAPGSETMVMGTVEAEMERLANEVSYLSGPCGLIN